MEETLGNAKAGLREGTGAQLPAAKRHNKRDAASPSQSKQAHVTSDNNSSGSTMPRSFFKPHGFAKRVLERSHSNASAVSDAVSEEPNKKKKKDKRNDKPLGRDGDDYTSKPAPPEPTAAPRSSKAKKTAASKDSPKEAGGLTKN